jgi:LacI family transcriptional regulator
MTNPFFPEVVHAFEEIAVRYGYEILLSSVVHDRSWPGLSVRRMIERQVDGVAIVTFACDDEIIAALRGRSLPVVCVGKGPPLPGVTRIEVDYLHGIRQAVQHLAAFRHRRIAFVTGPSWMQSAAAQKEAFEKAMEEISLEVVPELLVAEDHSVGGGMRACAQLLQLHSTPTAILCSSDMTAIGVMRKVQECRIAVPQDLSVVGFDGVPLSQFLTPELSTVQLPQKELATVIFRSLMGELNPGEWQSKKGQEFALKTNLVLRGSTALASINPPDGLRPTKQLLSSHANNSMEYRKVHD